MERGSWYTLLMSNDLSLLFAILIFPIICLLVGSAIITLLVAVMKRGGNEKTDIAKILFLYLKVFSILVGISIVGAILFIYIPTRMKDAAYIRKQNDCAQIVGYDSPADDENFSIATAQSQVLYRACIDGN